MADRYTYYEDETKIGDGQANVNNRQHEKLFSVIR